MKCSIRQAGFSLFEMLIALALLALIAGGLSGAMSLGMKLYNRTQVQSFAAENTVLRFRLRSWIEAASPSSQALPFPTNFVGDAQGFRFVTLGATPFAPTAAAMRVVVVSEEGLISLTAAPLDDDGNEITRFQHVLARFADQPEIGYFDASGETPGWKRVWKNPNRLPDLVRIRTDEAGVSSWPDFVVHPRLGQ